MDTIAASKKEVSIICWRGTWVQIGQTYIGSQHLMGKDPNLYDILAMVRQGPAIWAYIVGRGASITPTSSKNFPSTSAKGTVGTLFLKIPERSWPLDLAGQQ